MERSGRTPDELLEQLKTIRQSNREAYGRQRSTKTTTGSERAAPVAPDPVASARHAVTVIG